MLFDNVTASSPRDLVLACPTHAGATIYTIRRRPLDVQIPRAIEPLGFFESMTRRPYGPIRLRDRRESWCRC